MASICLYDIDFHHSSSFIPNLELMKVFNYYYTRGDVVIFGNPKENFDRFNYTIFFKANPNSFIPKALSLSGENKQIYGYGFFKKFSPLKEQYKLLPPIYLPYDLEEDKIKNISSYNKIKKGSLIRVENEDYSDFKKDSKNIFVSDYNFLELTNAKEFLNKYKRNYHINFLYPLIAKDQETFEKFFSVAACSNRRMIIDFKFDMDFFKKYYNENIMFSATPMKGEENPSVYLQRILKMILYAKAHNINITFSPQNFNKLEIKEKPLLKLWAGIDKWAKSKTISSCYDFLLTIMPSQELEDLVYNKRNIRLLLKQNPLTFSTEDIDFFN